MNYAKSTENFDNGRAVTHQHLSWCHWNMVPLKFGFFRTSYTGRISSFLTIIGSKLLGLVSLSNESYSIIVSLIW